MLDGHPFGAGCCPGRVVQDEHGHRGAAERGHREEALALPDRARGAHGPVQQPVLLRRVGLGVGIGPVRSGPRQQVAEAVLDGRRAVGQLVHRLGDSGLPLALERHLGQAVVNLHAAHQREVGHAQLPGLFPLPAVQARVRQGHPRLLGQHLQQEPRALRRRGRGPDDQVAGRPVAAGQRVGPGPRHVGQRDPPAVGRVDDGRQAGGLPARDPDVLPQAVEEDALRRARPQGLDRVRDVVQDVVLAVLLGQQHREHQHAPQRGELFADRAVMILGARHCLLRAAADSRGPLGSRRFVMVSASGPVMRILSSRRHNDPNPAGDPVGPARRHMSARRRRPGNYLVC